MVKNGTVKKTVLLFLAKLNPSHEEKIVLQEAEVEDARWVSFDEAAELLTFELSKNAWAEARKRLNQ
jgi:NADH pyrophosphatase NudC (nudix superfamily)